MENEKTNTIEQTLYYTYGLVNDLVRFAETKNGALVSLNGAACVGIVSVLTASDNTEIVLFAKSILLYLVVVLIFVFVGFMIAFRSFMPQKLKAAFDGKSGHGSSRNIFYYEDIAQMNAREYLQTLYKKSSIAFDGDDIPPKFYDLAETICAVAKTASAKFGAFSKALRYTLFGMIVPLLLIPVQFLIG